MVDTLAVEELTARISAVQENLRQLIEQAAGFSGAADEDRTSRRIAEQEVELARLTKERDELS
jgi:chromosome segregation ATPase